MLQKGEKYSIRGNCAEENALLMSEATGDEYMHMNFIRYPEHVPNKIAFKYIFTKIAHIKKKGKKKLHRNIVAFALQPVLLELPPTAQPASHR